VHGSILGGAALEGASVAGAVGLELTLHLVALLQVVEEAAAAVAELGSGESSRGACDDSAGNRADDGATTYFFKFGVFVFALVATFDLGFGAGFGRQVVVLGHGRESEDKCQSAAGQDYVRSFAHRNLRIYKESDAKAGKRRCIPAGTGA